MKIKEVVVVEGKDDVSAIKRAVEAEVIITNGFALSGETLKRIKLAQERKGVIIFTDPDYAGERIRQRISSAVPGCKHAFLPREEAILHDDIGIENASVTAIRAALEQVREETPRKTPEFIIVELARDGLLGSQGANYRRGLLGKILGIGYTNGKQFLNRLNNYGITREEYIAALGQLALAETSEQGDTYDG
ncbi:MAG: ribonuclease M5 [Thermincolia bacterium]